MNRSWNRWVMRWVVQSDAQSIERAHDCITRADERAANVLLGWLMAAAANLRDPFACPPRNESWSGISRRCSSIKAPMHVDL